MYRQNQRKSGMIAVMFGKTGERKGGRKSETVSKKGQVVLANFHPRYLSK